MDILTDLRIIATLLSFIVFIGICIWAFHRRTKIQFDESANIPFLDEDLPMTCKSKDRDE